jgi:Family of unknown function (DUF5946)
MPKRDGLTTHAYYNASPECWSVYGEVLANEYSNAVLFGQVHRQTVDSYAAQHVGGVHPDKSIDVHLAGLHLAFERKIAPALLPAVFQRLATSVDAWPHFVPPQGEWPMTVFDVAMSADHTTAVREWSASVWRAWSHEHAAIAAFVARYV